MDKDVWRERELGTSVLLERLGDDDDLFFIEKLKIAVLSK